MSDKSMAIIRKHDVVTEFSLSVNTQRDLGFESYENTVLGVSCLVFYWDERIDAPWHESHYGTPAGDCFWLDQLQSAVDRAKAARAKAIEDQTKSHGSKAVSTRRDNVRTEADRELRLAQKALREGKAKLDVDTAQLAGRVYGWIADKAEVHRLWT